MTIILGYEKEQQLIELLKTNSIEIERSQDGPIHTFPILSEWCLYHGDRGGCRCGSDRHGPQMVGEVAGSRYTIYFPAGMECSDPALGWLWKHSPVTTTCPDCE